MADQQITFPDILINRLHDQLGSEFEDFTEAMSTQPLTSIRLNPGKRTDYFKNVDSVPWCSNGLYLEDRPKFTYDPLFHAGTYYVQEASSMFLAHLMHELVDLKQDLRVLDLSAAPGGKSTLLQSLLSRDSLLVANEIIPSRNKVLRQNLTRWGGDNHIVTQSDPKYFKNLPGFFDVILVDAPCSGEGLMRKEPSAINEWSEQNVHLCAARQKRILADIIPALVPGGVLIYSTCTFSENENEENVKWIQTKSSLTPVSVPIPDSWGIQKSDPNLPAYRFYPHKLRGEGFFIAAFRNDSISSNKQTPTKRSHNKSKIESANTEDHKWLVSPERYGFLTREQHRIALPIAHYQDYLKLAQALRITSSGLNLGKIYHGQLKPSPELALSQFVNPDLPRLELNIEQALDYLAHINIDFKQNLEPGRYLVSYRGHGLGWLHVLKTGQKRNNYPSAWRILQRYPKQNTR